MSYAIQNRETGEIIMGGFAIFWDAVQALDNVIGREIGQIIRVEDE